MGLSIEQSLIFKADAKELIWNHRKELVEKKVLTREEADALAAIANDENSFRNPSAASLKFVQNAMKKAAAYYNKDESKFKSLSETTLGEASSSTVSVDDERRTRKKVVVEASANTGPTVEISVENNQETPQGAPSYQQPKDNDNEDPKVSDPILDQITKLEEQLAIAAQNESSNPSNVNLKKFTDTKRVLDTLRRTQAEAEKMKINGAKQTRRERLDELNGEKLETEAAVAANYAGQIATQQNELKLKSNENKLLNTDISQVVAERKLTEAEVSAIHAKELSEAKEKAALSQETLRIKRLHMQDEGVDFSRLEQRIRMQALFGKDPKNAILGFAGGVFSKKG